VRSCLERFLDHTLVCALAQHNWSKAQDLDIERTNRDYQPRSICQSASPILPSTAHSEIIIFYRMQAHVLPNGPASPLKHLSNRARLGRGSDYLSLHLVLVPACRRRCSSVFGSILLIPSLNSLVPHSGINWTSRPFGDSLHLVILSLHIDPKTSDSIDSSPFHMHSCSWFRSPREHHGSIR
jgi:hypothetical protein